MTALESFGARLAALRGWRRLACAFALGAFSALGFAPLQFFPALLLGIAGLLLLLDGADAGAYPLRAGFGAGWAFAFGQFLTGWHWIGYAFLVDPDSHLWQMPFALVFLTGGLALYAGLACAAALYFWQDGPARLFVFAVLYTAAEWVRGHAFTGFPWNLPAYGWGASLAVLQSASLIGAYGLSFFTLLLGASLADLLRPRGRAWRMPMAMLALFALLWAGGALRLAAHPTADVPGVRLRIVQPDIAQRDKDKPAFFARNWQRLLDLSARPAAPGQDVNLIVWPEAAPPPFQFQRLPSAMDEIGLLTGPGRTLITGATRAQRDAQGLSFYNSLYIFQPGGRLPLLYDKYHLVPFGEYVPFAGLLNHLGVTKLTDGQQGFSSGDGPHTYQLAGLPAVTPLICYEVIFPAAVTPYQQRPGWFVNVTDDSWFGPWAGPYQHLLIARVRAIEEGLPIVRAANTGISAVIDPYGRITQSLGLDRMGVLDARLPKAAPASTYARYGDLGLLVLLIFGTIIAFILARR